MLSTEVALESVALGVVVKGTLSVMDEVTTDPCPVKIYINPFARISVSPNDVYDVPFPFRCSILG